MELSKQVSSLEQSKKLKELGVSQESLFSWFGDEKRRLMDGGASGIEYGSWLFISTTEPVNNQQADSREMTCITKPIAAAFTVAELGVMLNGEKAMVIESVDHTEAGSRAEHLIWLLDNNHITAEEVNQNLWKITNEI